MRRYLVDSGLLAAFFLGRKVAVDLMSPWIIKEEAATSILSYAEVVEHLKGLSDFSRRHAEFRKLLGEVYPYFLTYSILERYADIRRMLRPPRGSGLIGDIDTLIAATAMEFGLTVVTTDSDFERVPGLNVVRVVLNSKK